MIIVSAFFAQYPEGASKITHVNFHQTYIGQQSLQMWCHLYTLWLWDLYTNPYIHSPMKNNQSILTYALHNPC